MRVRQVLVAATLGVAVVAGGAWAQVKGQPAPAMNLKVFGADTKLDNAAIKGKDTVLVFFNTACGICRQELKTILPLRDEMGFNLVLVNTDVNWEPRLPLFVEQLKLQGETIVIDEGFDLARRMGVKATPATVLVDKEGKYRDLLSGFGNKNELKDFLKF